MAIEKERASARLEASRKAKALRDAMYEQWKRDEAKVLRKPPVAGGAAPAEGAKAGAGKGDDLFNEPAAPKAAKPPEPGIKPDAKPAAKSDDPFGDEPADEKKPADAKKSDTKEPGDDPFGDAPAEKKPAEKKGDAPKAEDDPFGDEPAAPAAGKKPAEKPAEKPAPAKPDDEDPFK